LKEEEEEDEEGEEEEDVRRIDPTPMYGSHDPEIDGLDDGLVDVPTPGAIAGV
jgi:hypothetical protein